MAVDASAAADTSRQVAVEHSHQQETALMQALQAASAAAVVQEEEYRERTPRRRKDKNKGPAPEAEVKPEPAETPDPAKPGDTPVLTGKALQPFGKAQSRATWTLLSRAPLPTCRTRRSWVIPVLSADGGHRCLP